jgi:hypothetical protein
MSLDLHPLGTGYVLRKTKENGAVDDLALTPDDLLTLAQSSPRWGQLVLGAQTPTANAVSAFPVETISLNSDHHATELHLDLESPNGSQLTIAIPIEKARPLSARLPSYLEEMAHRRALLRNQ